ncbi:hypothetical protein KTO58_02680 [Chitinophaga pendula]|uniref:hypothetical protein n=1 Tax=Chitinophaga TaxID=79328 RepID=UPI0012FD361D|nr:MULTISPECIES: hypothetical protein [Chitinophaga]UCJ08105.1 hypothetical protein KTO58_02680 [Chitinophaga pendula]
MKKIALLPISRHELRHIRGGGKPVAASCPNAPCSIIFDCPSFSCYCNARNICVSSRDTFPAGTSF